MLHSKLPDVRGGVLHTATATPSHDGSELHIASSYDIRVYSCVTGDRLAHLAGHTAEVTAICRHPEKDGMVLTTSVDGSLRFWETTSRQCVKVIQRQEPIMGMVLADNNIAVVSTSWRSGEAGRVMRCNLETGEWRVVLKLNTPGTTLAISPSQDFVATYERNTVHCIQPHHPDVLKFRMHHTRHITCVAFDSTSTHIAAGDVSGRIIIWTGLSAAADHAQNGTLPSDGNAGMSVATIHWHANPVAALCFSQDGKYLLSGGEEAVLVVWQLLTLKRTYLPRLGGPISHITSMPNDATRYIVGQKNNVVRIVSLAAMQVQCSVYGVRPASPAAEPWEVCRGIALQPGSGYAVLPSSGAQLQFYDLSRDCHVAKLQVFARNVVAQSGGKGVLEPMVIHAIFTADAATLVTVESHPSMSKHQSGKWHALKFWDVQNAGSSNTSYAVNSAVNDPYIGHVSAVASHPQDDVIATTSVQPGTRQGELRIWAKHHFKRVPGSRPGACSWHWHCKSTGSHKGDSMHSASFSSDGSLLAVGTAAGVVLFDTQTCSSTAFLSSPFPKEPLEKVHFQHTCFLPGTVYLASAQVGGNHGGVCVWDLLTLTPCWIAEGKVNDVCAHPEEPSIAAVVGAPGGGWGVLDVNVKRGQVQSWWQQLGDHVARVLYAPSDSLLCSRLRRRSVLVVISETRKMMLLTDQSKVGHDSAIIDTASRREQTALQDIFVGRKVDSVTACSPTSGGELKPQSVELPFVSTESHLLPSPAELCSRLLASYLG